MKKQYKFFITIATVIWVCGVHGNISLDDMCLIFIASCIFRVLSGILLKLTGTQAMFYRLNAEFFTKKPQENETNVS